jgi:hypothetical protein
LESIIDARQSGGPDPVKVTNISNALRHLSMALQVRASHFNQIIDGIGSSQRCPKYRFFARTDHIDIIEVWMLVLRHTEPVADHFFNHHPIEALGF